MRKFPDIEEMVDSFYKTLPCQSEMPFPPIKVEKQNLEYANMLLDAYAGGGDSEMQAITQYIYHSKTISDEEISNKLMCIALIEMRHLDALSELINLLGGKPFFLNSSKNFWMTGNIAYVDKNNIYKKELDNTEGNSENVIQKIEKNINGEINAVNGYKTLLKHIKDVYIEKVILKIISDELIHIKILGNILEHSKR